MGEIATAGGCFTYFVIMQVYGFNYGNIFFLLSVPAVNPVSNPSVANSVDLTINTWYTYNASVVNPPYNNPYLPTIQSNATYTTTFPDWISTLNNELDLRGFYLNACASGPGGYCPAITWPAPSAVLNTTSCITGYPVAYTTESIFYAQSGYFVTIVMVQWSNVFACKSRKVFLVLFRLPLLFLDLTNICSEVLLWRRCCLCFSYTCLE